MLLPLPVSAWHLSLSHRLKGLLSAAFTTRLKYPGRKDKCVLTCQQCYCSSASSPQSRQTEQPISILGKSYDKDCWTNVSPRVLNKIGRNLHNQKNHPLNLIRWRIQNYFYANFVNRFGNPIFSVYDNLSPIVTVHQNFDSLLVPADHPSRNKTDSYYINQNYLLRAHTSAHEEELIKMGLDAFLVVGDVYRRDAIDSSHYPAFHQMEGARLFGKHELFSDVKNSSDLEMFEDGKRCIDKQESHTLEAVKLLEHGLKKALLGVTNALFGKDVKWRWVDCEFPFTHPSWELEILHKGEWMEVLGCGILEQQILQNAGAGNKVGWAFGLGLERLAMKLYQIPDIRLFWSQDPGFLNQFDVRFPDMPITYKPVSQFPPCYNDISFWIPDMYTHNDFYDLVRTVGGDLVEQVTLVDTFKHPKHGRTSHCYRITYRDMEKILTQESVNKIHQQIETLAATQLRVEIR